MNTIAGFRYCKLNNEILIKKVDIHTDNIYQTGKIPSRNIPARPDEDFDLLVGELLLRFQEMEKKLIDIQDLNDRCLSEDPHDSELLEFQKILEGKDA